MHIETSGQEQSLLVKKYSQDHKNTRNKYNLDPKNMPFDCANNIDKNVSARTEENLSAKKT